MKKFTAVCKNELIRYFTSPLAYVYLISFLLLNASFAIYFGDFFNRGRADLMSMFMYQPWLYLLFISGISMRLWAEEFHSKTIEQLVTMPVSITTLVLGKFCAAWIFCAIALALTFPFWIVVNLLGNADNTVIFMGYAASLVLAGCMIAISQVMSALTKNQVIALVLAVIANLVFFWSGIEYILAFFRLFLSDTFIDVIASFSFLSHFYAICNGLLELRDIIFFASLIIFANYTTVLIVNFKTAGTSGWLKSGNRGYTITAWIMLLLGFFGINILANNLTSNIQYDGTQEKLFTLTENSKKVLQNLKEPVTAKLYFSPILQQRNSDLREKFDAIRTILHKYKTAANGMFEYKIYYPKFLSTEEDIALANGVQSVPLVDLNQTALFGMTLEDTLQNKAVIPFFAQEEVSTLEQDITTKLYQLHHIKKNLGILSGIAIFGQTNSDDVSFSKDPWQIIKMLQDNYKVYNISEPQDFDKLRFDVLLMLMPKNLSPEMIEKIKTYSRNGGKIVLLLDPAHETEHMYTFVKGKVEHSDIGELEQFWGIKLYGDYVVADLKNSVTVDATIDYNKNPVFSQDVIQFRLQNDDMNPNHPITKNLQEIMLASTSIVMPDNKAVDENKIVFYPLLKASDISSIMTAKVVTEGLNPQEILKYFQPDNNQKIIAAEVISMEKDNPFNLVIIGDTDFIYDSFWMKKNMFLESEYVTSLFDNANFVLNAVDYLSGNDDLLELRGKRAHNRRFENIETMRRINALQYKQKENYVFEQINKAKQEINEIWAKKDFEGRKNFTIDEMTAISQIRERLNIFRQQLSDLRYQAFKDIKIVDDKVTFITIWLLPILSGTIFLLYKLARLLLLPHRLNFVCFKPNKRLVYLTCGCLAMLSAGLFSVYMNGYSSVDAYENKLVFPNLKKNINKINVLELQSNYGKLTFELVDGLWQLKENPSVPVYQERIRRLLTTISEARFFARKTDKAENLAMFNLLPLEDKNSKVVRINLKDKNNILESFNLGDSNIDIGRGAKAAYIQLDNKFQVWEISADFVDMELDWHKWTYSNLWDLRYGRIYAKYPNPEEESKLAEFMATMLNTPYIEVTEVPHKAAVKEIKLNVEDGNYVDISFYKDKNKAFAVYSFDKNNANIHLKLLEKYLGGKAVQIDIKQLEKLLEIIK